MVPTTAPGVWDRSKLPIRVHAAHRRHAWRLFPGLLFRSFGLPLRCFLLQTFGKLVERFVPAGVSHVAHALWQTNMLQRHLFLSINFFKGNRDLHLKREVFT